MRRPLPLLSVFSLGGLLVLLAGDRAVAAYDVCAELVVVSPLPAVKGSEVTLEARPCGQIEHLIDENGTPVAFVKQTITKIVPRTEEA